jgi:chemotaxis receptor (MCP) glutamine deamidase CheD
MKKFVHVHTGDIMAGNRDTVLESDATKACLVIAAYDPIKKVGGLAHALFLKDGYVKRKNYPVTRDVSSAIDEMVQDMVLLGSAKNDIEVCLVTGENVLHAEDDPEYDKTVNQAIELLKQKNIRIRKETTRDIGDLHASLDVETGNIICK